MSWKYVSTVTGVNNPITLPSGWRELLCKVWIYNDNVSSILVARSATIDAGCGYLITGCVIPNSTNGIYGHVGVTASQAEVVDYYFNNSPSASTKVQLAVWWR